MLLLMLVSMLMIKLRPYRHDVFLGPSGMHESVSQVTLRIDRVVSKPLSETLAQAADVTLDNVFIHGLIEEAVYGVEDLYFCDAPVLSGSQELQDSTLAARQPENFATYDGIALTLPPIGTRL